MLRSCAGGDVVDRFETTDASLRQGLSEQDRDLYYECVEQTGLEEALIVEIDVADIPEFVEAHNRETESQATCLEARGWDIRILPPNEDNLLYWEPAQSVFNDDGGVVDEFAHDADECAQAD